MSLRRRLDRLGPPADPPLLLVIYDDGPGPGADAYVVGAPLEFWRAPGETEDEFEARCAAAVEAYAKTNHKT